MNKLLPICADFCKAMYMILSIPKTYILTNAQYNITLSIDDATSAWDQVPWCEDTGSGLQPCRTIRSKDGNTSNKLCLHYHESDQNWPGQGCDCMLYLGVFRDSSDLVLLRGGNVCLKKTLKELEHAKT